MQSHNPKIKEQQKAQSNAELALFRVPKAIFKQKINPYLTAKDMAAWLNVSAELKDEAYSMSNQHVQDVITTKANKIKHTFLKSDLTVLPQPQSIDEHKLFQHKANLVLRDAAKIVHIQENECLGKTKRVKQMALYCSLFWLLFAYGLNGAKDSGTVLRNVAIFFMIVCAAGLVERQSTKKDVVEGLADEKVISSTVEAFSKFKFKK